ncbi:VOC family protein [Noviherbaspirillum sedimenti]|uniref:Oxidoreductase n=1 Tax=Noviherbaspirillum sedimenti TaxID=2320865 RepID=A0A3A3G866_9BURK|nr:VOC family protein [Noviherbaspirillum sedimenti]RJG04014.1 oxidoreductase [Noviherbaspirillum sedimenti]
MSNTNLITHLRHVGFAMPQLEEQRAFYSKEWGLTEVAEKDGVHYFAAEGSPEPYVIRLRKDDKKRADVISFGTATRENVDALAKQLKQDGVQLIHEPRELSAPGGGYGVRLFDLDGRVVEVSADVAPREYRDLEPGESIPARLSHCVINSPNPQATVDWYEKCLGFQVVETLHIHGNTLMWFMRCSHPQHHVLAVGNGPHVAMHHVSFDMRGIDEFLRGVGRLQRDGKELIWGPGRHQTGDNAYGYFQDAAGNTVEYTAGMSQLGDSWTATEGDLSDPAVLDVWGTSNAWGENVMRSHFNTPDEGLFVAPPL